MPTFFEFMLPKLRWYWVTRIIGVGLIVYAVAFDHTGERSTILLTGAGLLGVDRVARSEEYDEPPRRRRRRR